MTATTTTGLPDHYELALGHPVRSFVLTLVGIALALLILQWSGFVYPDVHAAGSGAQDLGDGAQTFTVAVQNGSPLPVEVVGHRVAHHQHDERGARHRPVGDRGGRIDRPLHRASRSSPSRSTTARPPGSPSAWSPSAPRSLGSPTVEVRTASGLRRHIDLQQPSQDVAAWSLPLHGQASRTSTRTSRVLSRSPARVLAA